MLLRTKNRAHYLELDNYRDIPLSLVHLVLGLASGRLWRVGRGRGVMGGRSCGSWFRACAATSTWSLMRRERNIQPSERLDLWQTSPVGPVAIHPARLQSLPCTPASSSSYPPCMCLLIPPLASALQAAERGAMRLKSLSESKGFSLQGDFFSFTFFSFLDIHW